METTINRIMSACFVIGLVSATGCGPSDRFQRDVAQAQNDQLHRAVSAAELQVLCANPAERRRDGLLETACEALEEQRERLNRIVQSRAAASGVAQTQQPVLTAPAATGAAPVAQPVPNAVQVFAPTAPPVAAMPPLCPGVDPDTINVPYGAQAVRETQGYGGHYGGYGFGYGSAVTAHVYAQMSRFAFSIVVNDQVQAAATGPFGGEHPSMILVRRPGGDCVMPAYMPGPTRSVYFTPNNVGPGQRLQVICWAQQPTAPGIMGPAQMVGTHTLNGWNPLTNPNPPMTDDDCRPNG